MNNDKLMDLVTALLDCGYGDLTILNSCEYDFDELVEESKMMLGEVNVNS